MADQSRFHIDRWLPIHRKNELKGIAAISHQVVTSAALVGVVTGLFVALLDRLAIEVAFDRILEGPLWLIAVLPGIGLLASHAVRHFGGSVISPATADEYLHAFHDRRYELPPRAFVTRMVGSLFTIGLGVPMGLEGPSLYAGSTIGHHIQRRLPKIFRDADHRVLLVAGAAAGVAAIFKAPATGAVFAMEVPFQDDMARRMLLPALVGGASGYLAFVAINGTDTLFSVSAHSGFGFADLAGAVAIGAVSAFGARLFALMLRRAKAAAAGPNPLAKTLGAAVVIGALFALGRALTGESLLVGSGYGVVRWASVPHHSVWLMLAILVMRCMSTSAAVAGGGVGGLFVPLVAAGALTGSVISGVIGYHDLDLFVLVGIAAFLGAGYRVPLASVMFVAETTGRASFIVPGLLAAVAAELLMGTSSVTKYQKRANMRVGFAAHDAPDLVDRAEPH